ncbi:MAG: Hsp20/alpha crystallin family protein [Armatimonadota bacterium]
MRRSLVPFAPTGLAPMDLLSEMDRMMRRVEDSLTGVLAPRPRLRGTTGVWLPRAEMRQTDDSLEVKLEIPGVPREGIEIETTAEGLTVRGERKYTKESESPEGGVYASEFVYGAFERYVEWPLPVKHEEAVAKLDQGVLTITVPLAEEAKAPEAKKVTIE